VRQVVGEPVELVGERARIPAIGKQQQDGVHAGSGGIAPSMGDDAFRCDQDRFREEGVDIGRLDHDQRGPHQFDDLDRAFEPPARVHRMPAEVANHALGRKAGEGEQSLE
jgi:hypothetical protein